MEKIILQIRNLNAFLKESESVFQSKRKIGRDILNRRKIKLKHLTSQQIRAIRDDSARQQIFLRRTQKLLAPLFKQKLNPEVHKMAHSIQARLNNMMILNHMIDLGAQLLKTLQERKRAQDAK